MANKKKKPVARRSRRSGVKKMEQIKKNNDIIKKYVDDRFKNLLEEYKPAIFELVRNTASMPITYFIKFIKQNVFKSEVSQLSLGF